MAARSRLSSSCPSKWHIYKKLPGLVLGFHGCDRSVGEAILSGTKKHLKPSKNEYDWLGSGVYFWEADPWRAIEFSRHAAHKDARVSQGHIRDPYAIGAVIDLGHCCNLLDINALKELKRSHRNVVAMFKAIEQSPPKNTGKNLSARMLDRLVVETMHQLRHDAGLPKYDTVRAAFIEGDLLYEGAGFCKKNHIQIAVCNPDCIKGYFRLPGL